MAIVSFEADLSKEPEITPEAEARLRALAEMPDDETDCADIPEITSLDGWMTVEEFKAFRAALRKERQEAEAAATV